MPTALLRPSAVGAYNAWILGAGASKQAAVDPLDPVAHDDDTSYIRIDEDPGVGPANNAQSFLLDTGIPGTIVAVNSLSLNTHAKSSGHSDVESYHHYPRLSGVDLDFNLSFGDDPLRGINAYSDWPGTVYRTKTTTPSRRPGGGTWAPSDFVAGNLEMVLSAEYDSALKFHITSTWATLEYVATGAGGGGFVSMLFSVFGAAAFGGQLTLLDVGRAAGLLARLRGVTLSRAEVREAWLELKEHRHPRTFVLGRSGI